MSTEVVAPQERAPSSPSDDAQPAPPHRRRLTAFARNCARNWLIDIAGISLASGLITVWLFRLWSAPLRVPLDYTGDGLAQLSVTKGIIETGWNAVNPSLGAPDGYVSYDFPAGSDNLHWLGLKVLSWFSSDAVLVTNLFFFASFVSVAIVALIVLRVLGLPRWVAHPMALLFTFLPFHAARGIAHLALANYVSVPLGCLIVLWAAQGRPAFFEQRPEADGEQQLRFAWRTPRSLGLLVACIVLGMAGVYYAVFTVVLLVVATAVALLRPERPLRAPLLSAVAVVAVIAVSFLVNTFPALRFQLDNGHNPNVAAREVWEVDAFALRPIQLVTPVEDHPIGALDRLGDTLRRTYDNSEPTQQLGAFGTVGLVLALAAVVAAIAGRRRLLGIDPATGLLILTAICMGVVGGYSWFTSLAGLAEIRSWNRISVFVGFLALYALGAALASVTQNQRRIAVLAPIAVAIVVLGVADQVPRSGLRSTEDFAAAWNTDARFFRSVDDTLPPDALVFQLPRLTYPEEPEINGEQVQELLKPYLHTRDLGFSFGGMRGRESDWQDQSSPPPAAVDELLDTISAVGYTGVLVDRHAYEDGGAAIDQQLSTQLGPPALVSEAQDWAFYPLPEGGDQALAAEARARPTVWWGDGFSFQQRLPDLTVVHDAAPNATATIVNLHDTPWRGTIRFAVQALSPGTYTLTVDGPTTTTTPINGTSPTEIEIPVELEGDGRLALRLTADAPPVAVYGDPRTRAVRVSDVTFSG